MKQFFILIFAVLFLSFNALMAADAANAGSISIIEGESFIIYYGTITFGTDSTANATTQAMYIGSANLEYGGIQLYFTDGTGTEDANGIIQFSNDPACDLTYFSSNTYGDLDQVQTTAKFDTLGVNATADDEFKRSAWMVIKMDGQSGNPASSVVNFYVFLQKKTNAPKRGTARVKATT